MSNLHTCMQDTILTAEHILVIISLNDRDTKLISGLHESLYKQPQAQVR